MTNTQRDKSDNGRDSLVSMQKSMLKTMDGRRGSNGNTSAVRRPIKSPKTLQAANRKVAKPKKIDNQMIISQISSSNISSMAFSKTLNKGFGSKTLSDTSKASLFLGIHEPVQNRAVTKHASYKSTSSVQRKISPDRDRDSAIRLATAMARKKSNDQSHPIPKVTTAKHKHTSSSFSNA